MAEAFDADSAWSLVWAEPHADSPAMAQADPPGLARWYIRQGAADAHLCRRGSAVQRQPGRGHVLGGQRCPGTAPRHGGQQLVGGTWTHEAKSACCWKPGDDSGAQQRTVGRLANAQPFLPLLLWRAVIPASRSRGLAAGEPVSSGSSLRQDNLFAAWAGSRPLANRAGPALPRPTGACWLPASRRGGRVSSRAGRPALRQVPQPASLTARLWRSSRFCPPRKQHQRRRGALR